MSTIESLTRAVREHQAGHFEAAEVLYRQILADEPDNANALNALGVLACQTGRADQALGYIQRAIEIDSAGCYHANLAEALRLTGRLDEALAALRLAVAQDPADALSRYNLGLVLQQLGQDAEAVDVLRQAIRHQFNHSDSYFSLAASLRRLNRLDEAIAVYDRVLEIFPAQTAARDYRDEILAQRAAAATPAAVPAPVKAEAEPAAAEELSEQEIFLRLSRRRESKENLLYRGLTQAIRSGDVRIDIDLKRINHIDCPVAGDSFSTQYLYATLAVAALVGWFVLPAAGAGVLALAALAYWLGLRRLIGRRTRNYVLKHILEDGALWDRLWRFGGVALSYPGKGKWLTCTAPADDWQAFIAGRLKQD